jgi:hypothetical protein
MLAGLRLNRTNEDRMAVQVVEEETGGVREVRGILDGFSYRGKTP